LTIASRNCATAPAAELRAGGEGVGAVGLVAVVDDGRDALPYQTSNGFGTDSARRAGDERDLAGMIIHVRTLAQGR
jgi:hypothetical protein